MAQRQKKPTTRSSRATPEKSGTGSSRGDSRPRGAAARRRSYSIGAPPGWVWLVAGVVSGALAFTALQYIQDGEDGLAILQPGSEEIPAESSARQDEENKKQSAQDSSERSYEFYDILMQDKVAIPKDEPSPSERRRSSPEDDVKRAPTLEQGYSYLLQAGSFRNKDDAEHLRASLALIGLPARIYTVELEDGQSWHRVRVGPIEEHEKIKQVRKRMEGNNIDPLLLRTEG